MENLNGQSEVVVLGAGVSGHTAALFLKRRLKGRARVTVISPESEYNWIPSNIWVGVGRVKKEDVLIPLSPVYEKHGINFIQGRAVSLYPEGTQDDPGPQVGYISTNNSSTETEFVKFDFLINATGPKLNFAATPGLGPDGHSFSVCTAQHAQEASLELHKVIQKARSGIKQTLVVGMGHGSCTCEGAAFEYVFNVDTELRRAGVREQTRLIYLTNESELGDFGVGGIQLNFAGFITPSKIMAESLFYEKGIESITGAHVERLDEGTVSYVTLNGERHGLNFDYAMLLPPFQGHLLKSFDRNGNDITQELFTPANFMKVDADYTPKNFEDWKPSDWPQSYRSPKYENIFAVGIAFAPPHQISAPAKNPEGLNITPAPPRTGMPSAVMGKVIANNIADKILLGAYGQRTASMAEMGAACIASIGTGFKEGSAASITMSPIVPDFEKYPETGRNLSDTFGEVGKAGHWIKKILHYMFIYKAKAKPLWWIIPE